MAHLGVYSTSPVTIPRKNHRYDQAKFFPEESVRKFAKSQRNPEFLLFRALVDASAEEPTLRHAGVATHFIQHIIEGYEWDPHGRPLEPPAHVEPPCYWELPLEGLLNVLQLDTQAQSEPAIIAEVRTAYPLICDVIWKDLNRLLPPGPGANWRRNMIGGIVTIVSLMPGLNDLIYSETSIALAMHCWLHMSGYGRLNFLPTEAVTALFRQEDDQITITVLDRAVRSVTVEKIVESCTRILADDLICDQALWLELRALFYFVIKERPFSPAFLSPTLCNSMVKALRRQLDRKIVDETSYAFNHASFIFLYMLREGAESTFQDFGSVFHVAAEGLIFTVKDIDVGWWDFFELIYHAASCSVAGCYKWHPSRRLLKACNSAMKEWYCSVLLRLQDIPGSAPVLMFWTRLAFAFGISEAGLRQEWIDEHQCCNPRCMDRAKKHSKTSQCARCMAVYYCSRDCQRVHWKIHKPHCTTA